MSVIKEIWKPLVGYKIYYDISNFGRLKSYRRTKPAIIKGGKTQDGYIQYCICGQYKRAHVLVLETFVGPRPDGCDACHNDGDPENNYVGNLRWATRKENCADAIKHGTTKKGEKQNTAKLTAAKVLKAREEYASGKFSLSELAAKYGLGKSAMYDAITGKNWSHLPQQTQREG